MKLKFQIEIKKNHILGLLIFISFLLYLNLYLDNFVTVENIVNSYSYEIITINSGAFSHLQPTLNSVLLGTLDHIKFTNVLKYLLIIILSSIPFLFFIKFRYHSRIKKGFILIFMKHTKNSTNARYNF